MDYPNPNYKLNKKYEPIGTGKAILWWLGPKFKALYRASAAHDCAYELKDMGFLWQSNSKDADKMWSDLYDDEIDKGRVKWRFIAKPLSIFGKPVLKNYGRKGWPKNATYRKEKWNVIKLEIEKWWLRAAPGNATREQKLQMFADIKFRYWRYD